MNAPSPIAVTVRTADLEDVPERARLDAFVAEGAGGTIFHRPQWSRAVERGCGQQAHYLIAERAGALIGCLPLSAIRSRLFGNALVSAGFGTGGGILADSGQASAALAEKAWALAGRLGCPSLELRGGPLPDGFEPRGGVYSNFARELSADAETLMRGLPRRQRAEVRRAERFGLTVSTGSDAAHRAAHYRVYAESVRNLGTPVFPRGLFEAMLDGFGDDAEITLVRDGDEPLAAMLSFVHQDAYQPVWGGGTARARDLSANDLAYFEVMRRAIARGCVRADFGRSKLGTGPWKRKKIWDFKETPLVYGLRTAAGRGARDVNPLSDGNRLKVEAWKWMPLWAANRLGPLLSRGLG